jgi:hypothetical protein
MGAMPWIRAVQAEEADGDLAKAYEQLGIASGDMTPPYDVVTNNGPVMLRQALFSDQVRFGDVSLSRLRRETIATLVSALNHCVF